MTPPDVHSSAGIDRTAAAGMAQQEKRIGQHPSASLQAGFSFAVQKGEKRIAPAAAGKRTQKKMIGGIIQMTHVSKHIRRHGTGNDQERRNVNAVYETHGAHGLPRSCARKRERKRLMQTCVLIMANGGFISSMEERNGRSRQETARANRK